ncbi:hypothetical protein [Phenylobacterium sp.]|uniref:hypothetical protein n=1 Tax=Phenylobacterium sp. TaxID=1871053 RepID=UPI002FDF7684
MRYQVTVTGPDGAFVCGATLRCQDTESALRRFEELPLPAGRAELRRGTRLIARRPVPALPRTGT